MVLIAIRAPILSLIITIISVICELAFLTAALVFMRYHVCCRLQKKQKVTVRSQHLQVLALTLFAMLAFVSIETITSIFSDPQTIQFSEVHPCVRTVLGGKQNQSPNEAEAIHFACTRLNGTTISHFEGNYSSTTTEVTCSNDPIYSYKIGELVPLPTENAVIGCDVRICAFLIVEGSTVYIGGPEPKKAKEVFFRPTKINSDNLERLDLKFIATSLASDFGLPLGEEGEIRRRALLGSIEDNCPFLRDSGSGTTIPLAVIIGAATVWAFSLLFFVASLFFRRGIFFDITHPMDWAKKVRHDLYRARGAEPELEVEEIDGERTIIITAYVPIKGD